MTPRPPALVAYLRVSTARQGASGLGLEAQRAAVAGYAASVGASIAAEYVEVESGRKADRPQLAAALAACQLRRATLVIAKLDRLARNVAFISALMESGGARGGLDFVACDMPHANRLTLHIMSAMAEHEAQMISQRTKAALAAAKARGVRLGNPNGARALRAGCREAAAASAAARREAAKARALMLAPTLAELHTREIKGAGEIARELNLRRMYAPAGGAWSAEQVRRLLRSLLNLSDPPRA